ncbi:MAG: hypothetical protein J3K34DRAFT_288024 [Monoraphidium minutum]|nr:MAG: hypothetical protein J3K34DRAFT_288024 [Monoraphidium minutum]
MVGMATSKTSIDFAMQVNQLVMAPQPRYRYGYVTTDSLTIENLANGDARSAEVAKPISVTNSANFWPLYYDRATLRNTMNNVTLVISKQEDLDYLLYWLTVYRSNLPAFQKMAGFLSDSLGLTEWRLDGPLEANTLYGLRCYTACVRMDYCAYTVLPQVAPKLPVPPLDPLMQDSDPDDGSIPLVVAVSTAAGLQAALADVSPSADTPGLRDYVIVLRGDLRLSPNATAGWPPPGGQAVPYPVSLLGEGAGPRRRSSTLTSAAPAARWPCRRRPRPARSHSRGSR